MKTPAEKLEQSIIEIELSLDDLLNNMASNNLNSVENSKQEEPVKVTLLEVTDIKRNLRASNKNLNYRDKRAYRKKEEDSK